MNLTEFKILDYCERHGSITRHQMYFDLGIKNTNKAISEMRKKGYVFSVERCMNGEQEYNRYRIKEKVENNTICIGQRVMFDPFRRIRSSTERIHAEAVGEVVWINNPHGWFSVQYGNNQRMSFHFHEVGKAVHICK